jgi:hypothetical protein
VSFKYSKPHESLALLNTQFSQKLDFPVFCIYSRLELILWNLDNYDNALFVTTSAEVGTSPCSFGGRRHRLSRHHRSMFHFRFVLSWSYTPGLHSINYVPYLTLWLASLFCVLLFVMWVRVVSALDYCVCSLLELYLFWVNFGLLLISVSWAWLHFSIHQHPHTFSVWIDRLEFQPVLVGSGDITRW